MNKKLLLKKIVTFVTGLFIMALGVALSVKANLGVSPISCIPYIFSLKYPLTMGQTTIIFNVLLILLQIVLLRKKYRLFQLVQLPVVILFGFFTDFTLFLVSGINISGYGWQVVLCLLSCAVIAFGVFLEVKAKLTYLAGEGVALAISEIFRIEFGKAKIITDSSMVFVGVISSLVLLSRLLGVREGTIVAALLVGYIAKFCGKKLAFIDKLLDDKTAQTIHSQTDVEDAVSTGKDEKIIITISREFGSGGHEIGEMVAKQLGLPFYDKNLIELTAEKSGFTTDYIQKNEQKLTNSLLYDLYKQNYAYVNEEIPALDALFLVQSKIIRDISEKNSCVIVGRCANFVLKDRPNCLNVFIHASNAYRNLRVAGQENTDPHVAAGKLEHMDKERENYCKHYTGKIWGKADNYHLAIDSSVFGIEKSAQIIIEAVHTYYSG